MPKLTVPGSVLIDCATGFVTVPRIKGSHNAILTGMLAAEEVRFYAATPKVAVRHLFETGLPRLEFVKVTA